MFRLRKSEERGFFDHGWLKTHHSFSFASYHDREHMGFQDLRVINEDFIDAGTGFDTHPHRDMEIITYVVSGALAHQDTMGNKTVILPGEVQRMSAGHGIQHSERNQNQTGATHLLQIWILPEAKGIEPSYAQKSFSAEIERDGFVLAASRTGRDGSISLSQDVNLYVGKSSRALTRSVELAKGRSIWIQQIEGTLRVTGTRQKLANTEAANASGIDPTQDADAPTRAGLLLQAGDGLAITDETHLDLDLSAGAHFILFDLN